MKSTSLWLWLIVGTLMVSCQSTVVPETAWESGGEGKLFIIGGGKRPHSLIERMIAESAIMDTGYVLIMSMASAQEDTAIFYSARQFIELGMNRVFSLSSHMIETMPDSAHTLIRNASIIYISGGDQSRFMEHIKDTGIDRSLMEAYRKGATIAGTSAGAAVMSSLMITGDQKKHPEYTGDFQTIEANNIVLDSGLGLLPGAIIDQHFIKRQRLNRLISVCLENPEMTGIGIDESTALLVKDGKGEVLGESQIIVIRHTRAETKIVNGLLGGQGMDLNVYLPGDTILYGLSGG